MVIALVLLGAFLGGVLGGYWAVRKYLCAEEDGFDLHMEAAQAWLEERAEAEEEGEGWRQRPIEDEPLCDDCLMAVLTLRGEKAAKACDACGDSMEREEP